MSEMISGASLGLDAVLDCDVVVIGSGGGGAPATYELARAGFAVICLEAGPLVKPEEFTQRELETIQRVYVDRGAQGTADGSLQLLQGRCVGGSTVINGEVCFRTPDEVLDEWSTKYFVGGMAPADMAPVFDEVERMINVTVNEDRYLDAGTRPAEGLRALGIEPKPIARNVKDCRGCCYCFFGCAFGCKQSMDQSYLPAAMRASARVIYDAEVERFERDGNRVTGVTARTSAGTLRVAARAVVLACGAVQTPLMLLDHGIGGDHVGRHLAVHPVLVATGLYGEDKPARVSAMIATYSDHWFDEGLLIELASGSAAFVAQGVPGIGRAHKELARQVQKLWVGAAIVRDLAAPGRVRRDKKGKKVIEYRLDGETLARVRLAMRRSAEIHLAAGATKVYFPTTDPLVIESTDQLDRIDTARLGPADLVLVSYHPQGSARLNTVTDNDGAVHGARNLYVMDTSLFPTPVGVNPQVSVMAVSTVLARRLADRLRAD